MLGDTGVAVHPENEALGHLIGRNVVLPLVGRVIPIVADDYADPEKGTGAVKITPAHDFNDFEVGKRHKLDDHQHARRRGAHPARRQRGFPDRCNAGAGDARAARARPLRGAQARRRDDGGARLAREGRAARPHRAAWRPLGRRHRALADRPVVCRRQAAGAAARCRPSRDGRTRFMPENWEKIYFDWLENIEPWCVSRQLWWGHQIPAWYGPDGESSSPRSEAAAQALALGALRRRGRADARRGRARHLVLLGALAVLDAGLAGGDAGARALLPDGDARHRPSTSSSSGSPG